MYNKVVSAFPISGHIRPVNPRQDLNPIADLIELCFASQMDEDGRDYLSHIRRAARDISLQRWTVGSNERVSLPLFGYVWEETGEIVGNLTLIPFQRNSRWRYLIANVATHPNFRGRGIARRLTQTAIEHVRSHGASAVWLQVRDDNPIAYHLYLHLGFAERVRRTTWELADHLAPLLPLDSYQISSRTDRDWILEEQWLQRIYPREVAWNLNFHMDRYAPSLWSSLKRFLQNERIEQWSIHYHGELVGLAIWDAGTYNNDVVWIAPNPRCEDQALSALSTLLRKEVLSPRPISINYPADLGAVGFSRAGFIARNTLIWMEIQFDESR